MKWLIADDVAREMRARISAGLATSPEVQGAFAEAVAELEAAVGAPRNLTVAGDIAQVGVEGLLTERPDFIAWLMGYANTTYSSIQQALAMADADPAVKRIELRINSPGGTVAGLFETLGAIEDTQKPISVTTSFAASAAYAIAARGGRITALTGATEVGSIGVAQSFYAPEDIIDVASTAAPKKRPDVRTEEGKAIVRERLDALHEQFVKAIAGGRGTTVEDVNTNFGQGGVFVAVEAKKRGMIDKIMRPALRALPRTSAEADATAGDQPAGVPAAEVAAVPESTAAPAGGAALTSRIRPMTRDELKVQHPELYAAVREEGRKEGHAAGLKAGAEQERDRVSAHLIRGQASGAMALALESIEKGDTMTETLRAKYDTAGKNRDDQQERAKELADANAAADGAASNPEPAAKSFEEQVLDELEKRHGIAS